MQNVVNIDNKLIGYGQPVFIIAEAGVNHNGSLEIAKQLIDVAAQAGVDAIKFQTFTAELLVTNTAPQADYQSKNTGKIESQFEMLKRLELPRDWHAILQEYAKEKGIIFLSTPFSEDDADFLESINILAYKIPSGEITNILYLQHIAQFKKPMIVSTGMATLEEVVEAVHYIQDAGNEQIIVLHSTSNYPPSPESLNFRAIQTLREALKEWNIPIGYSDNGTSGYIADVIAVAVNACVIEKHFTLDKSLEGPDHKASLNPLELKALVQAIRMTEVMLGTGDKKPASGEISIAAVVRKSVVSRRNILCDAVIQREDLIIKRPGNGIPPKQINEIIGRRAVRDIPADILLKPEDYE